MNSLDELLMETRIAEARAELGRERLRQRVEAMEADVSTGSGVRSRVGGWLVRAGTWLDPKAGESSSDSIRRKAGQRA